MNVYAIAILALLAFWTSTFQAEREERRIESEAAYYASYVQKVVYGYKRKIIDEESQNGYQFEGLATTNGATWTISGADVIYNLQSDGSSGDANHPACTDAGGAVFGLSRRGYVHCSLPDYAPYSDGSSFEATFTRTAPAASPTSSSYSQITGTITFGSSPGNPFSLDGGLSTRPNFAFKVWQHLQIMSTPESSNNTMATLTSYVLTADGTLEARIDLSQSNDIYIRSDGSVPFVNDQSMGNNSLLDVDTLVWGSASSELDTDGNIRLGGGSGSSAIYFDRLDLSSNSISLTSAGLRILSNETTVDGDLRVTGESVFEGPATFEDEITLSGSGVSLYSTPQLIGYVGNGDVVPFPECVDISRRRLLPVQVADIPSTSGAKSLIGFYPELSTVATGWKVELFNITEDGPRIPAGNQARIGAITFCDE